MQIVLINAPVIKRSPHSRLALPLGLAYIASALLMEGHGVSAIDFNISGLNERILRRIAEQEKPKVVGISAHTETYTSAIQIAKIIKAIDPNIQVVLGGPHPTILPEQVLENEAVDFVVVGEGEKTMVELARYLQDKKGRLEDIRGLGYKKGGITINERRELTNPEELYYPARELFPIEFYQDKWNVLTARGSCPFKCPFCSASFIWQGRRKERAPEKIMDEIHMLLERHGADYIFFTDDIFTLNKKWLGELLTLLQERSYPLEWGCATRVDLVDRQILREMAQVGCRAIQFGIESGSQKILDSVKGIKKEQALEAVQAAIEAEIDVASSFMIPFPDDTKETIRETKEFIKEICKAGSKILLSYTTPYPGTYFYQHADDLGIKILADSWDQFDSKQNVMATKNLSTEEIEELVAEVSREAGLKKKVF